MRKVKKAAAVAAPASTVILVAVGELRGGTIDEKTKERQTLVLADGEELTAEKKALLGLDDDMVADLVGRGKLAEVKARVAAGGDDGALQAALARIAELEAEVMDLTGQLADATKPAE